MPLLIPGVPVNARRHSHVMQLPLAAPRRGVMLHYDDSSRDDWAVEWFMDPRCTNGYTWLVLDDGQVVELADPAMRTPHAGTCRTPQANSRFYGVAAATNGQTPVTIKQFDAIVATIAALFKHHGWLASEVSWRIVGHDAEAVFSRADTPDRSRWGRLGRKVDPTGLRTDRLPILDVLTVRHAVAWRLSLQEVTAK